MDKIGINVNTCKDKDGKILNYIKDVINKHMKDIEYKIFNDSIGLNEKNVKELDMIIVLGGDGTILRTARAIGNFELPLLGVNIGNLGFLASVEISEFEEAIVKMVENKYFVEKRTMLKCGIQSENITKSYESLNDIVVSKGALSRIVEFDIEIDNNFYTNFTADGIIISTPTGSTAYSLSAGGPIICPTLDLVSITPICPHTLEMRTIIIDPKSEIKIKINSGKESVFLTLDGQEAVCLNKNETIFVGAAENKCNLVKLDDYNYFNILRNKIISRKTVCEGDK